MATERLSFIRFYEELNDFLPEDRRKQDITFRVKYNQTVKDAIESLGVPHAEVDLILVNGRSVDFDYKLKNGNRVSVYPVFETLDISKVTKLRSRALREVRFILDVHLGKLCRYLRMLGFDTYYRNDLDDPEIIERSVKESRIILTRDIGILKNGVVTHGYWLRSQDSKKQLGEVIRRFDLGDRIRPFYRCIVCNGTMEKVDKADIEDRLENGTKKCFDEFYRCRNCKKIYWEGSHYTSMREFVDDVLKL